MNSLSNIPTKEPLFAKINLTNVIALTVMLLYIGCIHYFFLSRISIRLDEAQSLFQTNRDLAGLFRQVGQDVHVPLYHLIIHYWQYYFGSTIESVRLVSVIFFMALVLMTYHLAKLISDSRVGLFAAAMVSISPFLNWYGTEARMYTLLVFLVALNQYFFILIFRGSKWPIWIGYTISAVLGIYTHYFFGLILLTQVVFFLFHYRSFPRHSFAKFLAFVGVFVSALVPWLLFVLSLGGANNTKPLIASPTSQDIFNAYAQYLFGFQNTTINTVLISFWPLLVLLAFYALQKQKIPLQVQYLVVAMILPLALAFVISLTIRPIFLSRYLSVSLPALYIFIAWAFLHYPKKLSQYLVTLLIIIMGVSLVTQLVSFNTPVKENYEQVANFLTTEARPNDIIILSSPFTVYPFEYHYRGVANYVTLPNWNRFTNGNIPSFDKNQLPAQAQLAIKNYSRVWLVLSYDQGYEADIKQYFDSLYNKDSYVEYSPKLGVSQYTTRYEDPITLEVPKQASP